MNGSGDIYILELKDTIAQLNNTISAQNQLIASLQKTIDEHNASEEKKNQIISNLQAQLDFLKQKLFGSTSELRHNNQMDGQLSMFDSEDSDEKPAEIIEPEIIDVKSYKKTRKPKATYDEIFANIPTREVPVDEPSADRLVCGECGTLMVPIGTEVVRTEIIYTQPKLERIKYIATTYECPKCKETENPQFYKNEGAPALIPGSYVSESLLTHVLYSKYVMGLPLKRLEDDFNHLGVNISRTTMANWVIHSSKLFLEPIYEYMHRKLVRRRFLMADETPLQVLKEPERRPQSKSYVWLMRTGEDGDVPIILFNYTPTRAGNNAATFLKDAPPGYYLMVDGYQGYNKVPQAKRCCCYVHIRRYFFRAIPKGHERDYTNPAVQAVMYCDKLFAFEKSYAEKGLSFKQRYNRRLKDEKPVIEAFLSWIDSLNPKDNGQLKRAIKYVNSCRPYMMNYLDDGRCSLHNNASENCIRPLVIGRKNFLFSDSQDGADASMKVYSMIETAKANSLDPEKYLSYLLKHRPNKDMSDDEFESLMPWNEAVIETCKS